MDKKLSERVRPDCEAAPWVIEEIKLLEAALEAKAAPVGERRAVQDGWKLVPVEPTPQMLMAGDRATDEKLMLVELGSAYSAMLDAAPSAPKADDPVKVLPYWEPCNPGCHPELNGYRDWHCHCEAARAAIAAARKDGGKV